MAEEHYAPLGPSDDVPTAPLSVTVALADKLDTLTGFWAIDEKPTGSKDPFALRRAALGVIRLVLENDCRVRLLEFIGGGLLRSMHMRASVFRELSYLSSLDEEGEIWTEFWEWDPGYRPQFDGDEPPYVLDEPAISELQKYFDAGELARALDTDFTDLTAKVSEKTRSNGRVAFPRRIQSRQVMQVSLLSFFQDRLKVFLKDQGIRHDIIDACIAMPGNDDLTLLVKRAKALSETLTTDDGENLLQGFKRANNILTQAEDKDGVAYEYGADIKFAETDSEKALFAALDAADAKIAPAMAAEDFTTAMTAMAGLRGPIDAFFDDVKINADSEIIRRNRLNLLSRIRTICLSVADLTRIEG